MLIFWNISILMAMIEVCVCRSYWLRHNKQDSQESFYLWEWILVFVFYRYTFEFLCMLTIRVGYLMWIIYWLFHKAFVPYICNCYTGLLWYLSSWFPSLNKSLPNMSQHLYKPLISHIFVMLLEFSQVYIEYNAWQKFVVTLYFLHALWLSVRSKSIPLVNWTVRSSEDRMSMFSNAIL